MGNRLDLKPILWALKHDTYFKKLIIPETRQKDLFLSISEIFQNNITLTFVLL